MATSGYFETSDAGNFYPSPDRVRFDWSLVSQDTNANTSTISWSVKGAGGQNSSYWTQNFQSITDVNGSNVQTTGSFQMYQATNFGSGNVVIAHNADGTKNFSASNSSKIYYNTTNSTGSGSWDLPTIPRYATISSLTYSSTDASLTLNVSTDVTCDLLEYSTNNGSSYTTGFSGDFTSKSVTISDLPSDTTYQMIVRVRRKDSQLKTTSGMTSVTTATQNNFIGFM